MDERIDVMGQPRARVGLIIPSGNTLSEPQFNHFAPAGLGVHVTMRPESSVLRGDNEWIEIGERSQIQGNEADAGHDAQVVHRR
jgi:maleate cis-trans isomerase